MSNSAGRAHLHQIARCVRLLAYSPACLLATSDLKMKTGIQKWSQAADLFLGQEATDLTSHCLPLQVLHAFGIPASNGMPATDHLPGSSSLFFDRQREKKNAISFFEWTRVRCVGEQTSAADQPPIN